MSDRAEPSSLEQSLIERGVRAQWRPRELSAQPMKEASEWIGGYRQFWEAGFDRLDEHLRLLREPRKETES